MDNYEIMARKYIEGPGGLFDLYKNELAIPVCEPPEVESARWIIACLSLPKNRDDLMALVAQSDLRAGLRGFPKDSEKR